MKVNFTKEHFAKLVNLVAQAAMNNISINTKLGQPLNIVELLHTTSINTLNNIKASLTNKIRSIEDRDEWIETDTNELENVKAQKELVNLIVGWRRWKSEVEENRRQKEQLTKKLEELKESTKTPEDKIKELEAKLAGLDTAEDFQ
jgi:DNA repair exonuclease SbcCD ATPase subunit